ncbi:MAG: hypothetical protein ABI650_01400 [Dokdonella sp.]
MPISPMSSPHFRDTAPRVLPELRFWVTNLEVLSLLIGQHEAAAFKFAARLQKAADA